ncbi:acylneuraminate cytidylyltransferase family protein [Candidatus Kaiserbacteria bacterium]|nr:acylneuraminate cytidylyltransferase family protein [Candidatus Kaiserbacteria bacterium]
MIGEKSVLALIPARGGSKRIPKKNIKELVGKPLIAYAIEEGKKSKYIDRLIVSTDDAEIAEVSKRFRAEVPFVRPAELAADAVTDYPVFVHALEWLEKNENWKPDIIVQLRPTSPLRTVVEIDAAIELLAAHPEADSVRTVAEPEQSPYKMYKIGDDGLLEPLLTIPGVPESFNLPQQKLPKAYKHVGYVDAVWRTTLMDKGKMTGTKILPLVLEHAESGINTLEDWERYEYLLSRKSD